MTKNEKCEIIRLLTKAIKEADEVHISVNAEIVEGPPENNIWKTWEPTGRRSIQIDLLRRATNTMKHPIQPLEKDKDGIVRFKANAIVRFLLDAGPYDMNQLAVIPFDDNDREQFAQLIGYSLGGFSELSYVSDETYRDAEILAGADS